MQRVLLLMAAVVIVIVLLYVVGGRSSALMSQAIITGLLLGGVYALVSMGLTLIFGVLGIVNFAQGTLLTLAMYVVFVLVTNVGLNLYVATIAAVLILFAVGYFIQAAMLNRLMRKGQTEGQLLVTLGLSLLIMNILLMAFTGRPKTLTNVEGANFRMLGAIVSVPRLIAFAAAIVLAIALTAILRRTKLGTTIRAVSVNPEGAQLVGVNVRHVFALTFGIGAACVGAAGGLILPFFSLTPSTGEEFTILAFVIVVLGGLGSVAGAVVGGLLIGLVQTVGALYLPGTGALLLVFVVFVVVLLFRPQGMFGEAQ